MQSQAQQRQKLDISILYVESEENIRNVLTGILLRNFREVITARNGAEGVEKYLKKRVDIIITDIRMPEMSGVEMIEHIRALDTEVPIIITTAFSDAEYFTDLFHMNINRFILKPIDSDQLERAIYELIEYARKKQELKYKNQLLNEYKKAVDSSAIVSKTNKHGIITYANSAFCEISGYSLEELIGKAHNIVRHKNMPSSVFKELWDTILSGNVWKGRIKNSRKDGTSYTVEATIIPICDSDGDIVEFIALRYDITELLAMKEEQENMKIYRASEPMQNAKQTLKSLHALLQSMPMPSLVIDKNDNIIAFNNEFESLFDPHLHKTWIDKLKESMPNLREILSKESAPILRECKRFSPDIDKLPTISLNKTPSAQYIIGSKSLKDEESERFVLTLTPSLSKRVKP